MEKKVRLIALISIAAIVLAAGLLAIPQFIVPNNYPTLESISGYQFFFHAVDEVYENKAHISGVIGLGIASIVLMVLALASYVFFKKSSAFVMLGGIINVATSVLFFMMEVSKKQVYGTFRSFVNVGWVAYVIGAILILTGLASIYYSFRSMQQEKKDIANKKNYSYLKK